ncbi:hypothetical protein BCR43DRAFT_484106 [Syncephalastrum racemosum]|uniref:C2H2-type domain-containing protein n=1 Tax=Syncephalastrum racemosum TaxID=13706 RepID=A0A1X2HWB4_SYNRA|nr:hypothetical protein BCR43DRAFT_484106 [Syncephalastrum racemosum]
MNYEEPQQQPHQPIFYSPLPFLSPDVATASLSGSPALNTPAASTAHGMHPSPVQHTNTNTALNQMSWQMHKNDFDLLMDPALYFDGNPISVLLDKSRAVPEATSYQSEQVFNLDSLNTHYQQPLDFGAYTPETTVSGADLMSMQGSPAINIPASNNTPMIPQHQQLTFYSGGGVFENDNAQTETPYLEEHVFSSTGNYYHHDNNAQQHDTSSLFPPLPSDETEFIEDKRVRGKVKEEQAEEDQEKEDQEEEEEEEEFQETRRAKKPRRKSPKFHPCPECHRTFDRKYNMTTHLRTHDKARKKPFQCRVGCKKAFDRKHDRERHEASVHRQERLYTCGRCSASFARRDALSKHEDMCC